MFFNRLISPYSMTFLIKRVTNIFFYGLIKLKEHIMLDYLMRQKLLDFLIKELNKNSAVHLYIELICKFYKFLNFYNIVISI